ncbi:sodium-dependent transporter [Thermodesulfobacteriota bacterium]
MTDIKERAVWNSKMGFILAAIGSAIGLGNIWRFSYMAFEYGGGAFLIPYIVAIFIAGIPLMILEYTLGHKEKGSPPLALARVSKRWEWLGWWMPLIALFGIMLYYSVIVSWCVNYLVFSIDLSWGDNAQEFFFNEFLQLSDSPANFMGIRMPILFGTVFVWIACWFTCYRGINHGIEKACLLFMPLLFILTLVLVGWTVQLDGAWEAIKKYYLTPQWDQINFISNSDAAKVWISAFGQIFFTLSLGFGIMVAYASYLPEKTDITGSAKWTVGINCVYSFIAGFAVFGIVGFMSAQSGTPFNEVIKDGPQLAFVVYPEAIRQLPIGQSLFGVMFFIVLILAGLSSGVSLIEAFSCSLIDKFGFKREKVVTIVCILGFLGSLIFTTRAGLLILDITDHYVTNFGLVMAGFLECILVGWILKARRARQHINESGGRKISIIWEICIRYITPIFLLVMIALSIISELKENYGGYSTSHLIIFGLCWIIVPVFIGIALSRFKWSPEQNCSGPVD